MNSPKNATERCPDYTKYILIVACIVGVCVDPFFLYIPFLSHTKKCLGINTNLWKVAVALKTVADSTYILLFAGFVHTIKRGYSSRKRFLWTTCAFCLALAPIPQILFSEKFILKTLRGYTFWNWSLFCHYGTRLVLIFLYCEDLKMNVSVKALVRFNALVYLLLYIIVSHLFGASWYYLSIKRQVSCWNHACKIDTGCIFDCDGTTTSTLNSTLVNEFCPLNPEKFGIYLDALQSGIVEDKGVLTKFLQCFFWGLRNLSSFASNLQTSTNGGETFFAIIISVVALLLLIYIIGNIQRYAELASAGSERIEDKMELIKPKIKLLVKSHNLSQYAELWIAHIIKKALENDNNSFNFKRLDISPLPTDDTIKESLLEDLRILETSILNPMVDIQGNAEKWLSDNKISYDQNIFLFYMKCGLEDNQDVNLKSVLSVLPYKHQWMTKKDLCFDTLKKVPGLQNIDEEWFRRISSKLEPVIYPKEHYIFREGEPLEFIIFITNGILWNYTASTDAGGRVCVSINSLEKGDFFGEELVQWKLDKIRELNSDRIPLSCIPISTANVKSHTQVEALVLMINDLALSSDFPVATSILWRIDSSRSANSAAERVDSSSRTEEGASVQREIAEV